MIKIISFLFFLIFTSCQNRPILSESSVSTKNHFIKKVNSRQVANQKSSFKFFKSWKEAKSHFQKNVSKMTVYPPSMFSAGYRKLDKLSQKIIETYGLLYPEQMEALNGKTPWFLIVEQSKVNAAIYSDGNSEKNMYYIVLTMEALTLNDNALSGLLAHELAHLFLQKSSRDPLRSFPVERYYDLSKIKWFDIKNEKIPMDSLLGSDIPYEKVGEGESTIRLYTKEDHADEVMLAVLKKLNIPVSDLFLSLSAKNLKNKSMHCDERPIKEPKVYIAKGEYNPCWRWWRLNKLDVK